MSSHVVVIATDLRRVTIKVTPGTYLADVLQEACKKLNLSSNKYLMKNRQKQVDLSVPFRTSGLIAGAKLELVQKSNTPSAIQVGLQVPHPDGKEIPGGRLIKKFPSDLTLWQVLRQFESGDASQGRNLNITARGVAQLEGGVKSGGGQLFYETPVLNIMGRELASFADFQKTLSQLGYNSGSVLIRLSYKKTDRTLYEAMEQIGQYFKEVETEKDQPQTKTTEESIATAEDAKMLDAEPERENEGDGPSEDSSPQKQPPAQPAADAQEPLGPSISDEPPHSVNRDDPYQPVNVFLAPSGTAPAAASAPVNETDYLPTVAHAQLHQTRLQDSSRNRRLPSDKELEEKAAAEQAKIAAVKSVLIKVRFPDNTSSDWQIGPAETGAFLYEAVRRVMANSDQPFRLVIPGSKEVIKDLDSPGHTLIKAYKLSGRVLVSLVWDDSVKPEVRRQPFLKTNVARQGQAVKVQDIPQATEEKEITQALPKPAKEEKSSGDGMAKKLPKWFKMGKK